MNRRDMFIDAMGMISSRHVKAHINRVQPTGIRKHLVYPVSAAVYAVICVLIFALIPIIIMNIPKAPNSAPSGTVPNSAVLPITTEEPGTITSEPATTEPITSEAVTTESDTEVKITETKTEAETLATTPAPVESTPTPETEPPQSGLNISEQVMLSPTSAMRSVNGVEFTVTVTSAGRSPAAGDGAIKEFWKNNVDVILTVENKGNETVYGCNYFQGMFPIGAAMYADGEPASDVMSEYATYSVVEDFDPTSGHITTDNPNYNPSIVMQPGFAMLPPVNGSLYNGGDATIGKSLEIRVSLAVFQNPSENLKNGIFTKDEIANLVFVDIVIPWDRNTVVE